MFKVDPAKVFWRTVAGQTMICHAVSGESYALEGTAEFIWPLVVQGKSPDEISKALMNTFDIDQETAQRDINTFLRDMCAAGLIEEEQDV